MENQSKVGWALAGVRTQEEISQEEISKLLTESFLPEKKFTLFLCGEELPEKTGTLEEMEVGLSVLKAGMEDYEVGDYAIISRHDEVDLLFVPVELDQISPENA
jgi:hypothetical protein